MHHSKRERKKERASALRQVKESSTVQSYIPSHRFGVSRDRVILGQPFQPNLHAAFYNKRCRMETDGYLQLSSSSASACAPSEMLLRSARASSSCPLRAPPALAGRPSPSCLAASAMAPSHHITIALRSPGAMMTHHNAKHYYLQHDLGLVIQRSHDSTSLLDKSQTADFERRRVQACGSALPISNIHDAQLSLASRDENAEMPCARRQRAQTKDVALLLLLQLIYMYICDEEIGENDGSVPCPSSTPTCDVFVHRKGRDAFRHHAAVFNAERAIPAEASVESGSGVVAAVSSLAQAPGLQFAHSTVWQLDPGQELETERAMLFLLLLCILHARPHLTRRVHKVDIACAFVRTYRHHCHRHHRYHHHHPLRPSLHTL